MTTDKVLCATPTPGKQPTRIDRWKYELIASAILTCLKRVQELPFQELFERVATEISPEERERLGSLTWYVTTVKLDLECRGLIERLKGPGRQRLRGKG